jgi:hypothetical protein
MSQAEPPPPLNYRSPSDDPAPSRQARSFHLARMSSNGRRLLAGLGVGTLVSLLVWVGGWKYVNEQALLLVPCVKLLAGVVLLCIRGWRAFGTGIILSIAIGVLIFFGQCAANFKI